MTKYSQLTDKEEAIQLIGDCDKAIRGGIEFVWDLPDRILAKSITHHVNALALTGLRRRTLIHKGAYIPTPEGEMTFQEYLAALNLDQIWEEMPPIRGSLREANPAYKGTPIADIKAYATRLIELLPETCELL